MGLHQQLADFKAEFMRTAPAGRPALVNLLAKRLITGFRYDGPVARALALAS